MRVRRASCSGLVGAGWYAAFPALPLRTCCPAAPSYPPPSSPLWPSVPVPDCCPPAHQPATLSPADDGWGDDAAAAPTNAQQQQQTEGQWGSGYAGSGYGAPPPAQEQQRFGFGGYGSGAPPAAQQQSCWNGAGGGGGGGVEFNDSAEVLCSNCNGPCHKRTSNTQKNPGRWVLLGLAGAGTVASCCRLFGASLLRRQLCCHQARPAVQRCP